MRTVLLGAAIFCAACARAPAPPAAEEPERPPLKVEVLSAYVADTKLTVKLALEALTTLATDSIVVTLRGFRDGSPSSEKTRRLSELFEPRVLNAGQQAAVLLDIPAAGVSEYQVECAWGAEDAPATPAETAVALGDVTPLRRATDCPTEPCDVFVDIAATIRNLTDQPVQGIELALGIFWVEAGSRPVLPADGDPLGDNEELIALEGVTVAPRGEQEIKVSVDRPLPQLDSGAFVPHLRVLRWR